MASVDDDTRRPARDREEPRREDAKEPLAERVRCFLGRLFFTTLAGVSARDWWRILRDNRFAVSPRHWPRAAGLTAASLANSLAGAWERKRYDARFRDVEVKAPLFILGHWRSGTTHLHNLLCRDRRLAGPTLFQVLYPRTFLTTGKIQPRFWSFILPRTRLIDRVRMGFDEPYEDEFALCLLTLKSQYLTLSFPRRKRDYDRYLSFRGVPDGEVAEWKEAMLWFAKKLTWKYGRPLVFKSPPHTCRIRLLLDLFPDARFVHIHRDPYTVFRSTRTMWEVALAYGQLQSYDFEGADEIILERYRNMYDVYLEERDLIPAGRLLELGYSDLVRDPEGELRRIYGEFDLPPFEEVETDLRAYLESLRGYRKNRHREIPDDLRRRIASRWERSFEEWGYPV